MVQSPFLPLHVMVILLYYDLFLVPFVFQVEAMCCSYTFHKI